MKTVLPTSAIAALALIAAAFLPTLISLHGVWTQQPYTHGYLVVGAVAWLAWREREKLETDGIRWGTALPLAAVLSLVWLMTRVMSVRAIEQAILPPLLLLWVAGALGRGAAARLAPLAAILLLTVPVWEMLTLPLQWMTVAATGVAVGLFGIPATIDGNVVRIPSGSFLIEGGCAGLNYFMAALVIGAVYAQGFLRAWPARLTALGLLAGMSVVGNWFRVSSLIAIGHATEMQSGLMESHLMYGWVIFAAGIVAFYPLTGRLEAWEAKRWPSTATTKGSSTRTDAAGSQNRSRAVAFATAAVVLGPVLYLGISALPVRQVPAGSVGPTSAWLADARAVRPFSWRPAFQGADEELHVSFTAGDERVLFDRFVYQSQGQRGELIGFSSRIAPDSAVVVERLFLGPERRLVNEAIIRDGEGHILVWYWYRVAGVETPSAVRAKALELWAFMTRTTTSELISISAPCAHDDCAGAARSLQSFLGA